MVDAKLSVKIAPDLDEDKMDRTIGEMREQLKSLNAEISASTSKADIKSLSQQKEQISSQIKDLTGPETKSGGSAGGGFLGAIGGKIGGMLGPIGIALAVITSMKPLMKMVNVIIKMLVALLQPITDMVMILLMPILGILKPILIVVRTIMAPFRKAAMQLSGESMKAFGEGDMGKGLALAMASFSMIFMGIETIILDLITETLKGLVTVQGELLKSVLGFIADLIGAAFPFAAGKMEELKGTIGNTIDTATSFSKGLIDGLAGTYMLGKIASLKQGIENLGIDSSAIKLEDFGAALNGIFQDAKTIGVDFEENAEKLTQILEDQKTGIAEVTVANMFQNSLLVDSWENSIDQMKEYMNDVLNPKKNGEDNKPGFFSQLWADITSVLDPKGGVATAFFEPFKNGLDKMVESSGSFSEKLKTTSDNISSIVSSLSSTISKLEEQKRRLSRM